MVFYIAGAIAVVATLMTITRRNAVHALLYLIVSLLAVALVFFVLGAPFAAALEVIIYAGAIMVLFLFVVMMLNLGREAEDQERRWQPAGMWIGPGALAFALLGLLVWVIAQGGEAASGAAVVGPRAVGMRLYGPYVLAVQLAALVLLAGLVGASHLRRREYEAELKGGPPR